MLAHYWKAEKFTASQKEGNNPLGAGTADPRITEPERATSAKKKRAEVTRGSKKGKRGKKVPRNTKSPESAEEERKENVSAIGIMNSRNEGKSGKVEPLAIRSCGQEGGGSCANMAKILKKLAIFDQKCGSRPPNRSAAHSRKSSKRPGN